MSTTQLHLAAFDGDENQVNQLLAEGADANALTPRNETPLMFAAMRGHISSVRTLLKYGADVNALPTEGHSALRLAIRGGHAEIVRLLIEKGADPEAAVPEKPETLEDRQKTREWFQKVEAEQRQGLAAFGIGQHPNDFTSQLFADISNKELEKRVPESGAFRCIMLAISSKSLETLRVLLEAGYSPKQTTSGASPLDFAQSIGTGKDMVRLLLKYGADPNGPPDDGARPLQMAIFSGNLEYARALIEAEAKVDTEDAGMGLLSTAILREDEPMIEFLLERNIGVTDKMVDKLIQMQKRPDLLERLQQKRGSAWLALVRSGDRDGVRVALQHGANINVTRHEDEFALMIAVENEDTAMVHLLLESGADVHRSNTQGLNALHAAVRKGNREIVAQLLKYGADVHAKTKRGQTPLLYAAMQSSSEIADLLLAHGTRLSVVEAILLKRFDVVDDFWTNGTPVNHANESGMTPLHAAISIADAELVASLLQRGANVEAMDSSDYTPLLQAVHTSNPELVRLLLEKGANPATGNKYTTPLKTAVLYRNEPIVRLLLEGGAPILQSVHDDRQTELRQKTSDPELLERVMAIMYRKAQLINDLFILQNNKNQTENKEPIPVWRDTNALWSVVRTLIAFGWEVNSVDEDGYSLLLRLIEFDAPLDLIQEVINRGASVNATTQFQKIPLMMAIGKERLEVIKALLIAGANPNGGLTQESPLQVATDKELTNIVALLEKYGASEAKRQYMVAGLSETSARFLRPATEAGVTATIKPPSTDFGNARTKPIATLETKMLEYRQRMVEELQGNILFGH